MKLLKGVGAGTAMGADELGRYLSPDQRAALVAQLSGDVEARAAALVADARAAAAAILEEAEAQAEAVRARAHADGFAAGHAAGHAGAVAELAAAATLLRRAAEASEAVRTALLAGIEAQTVALALAVARKVVDAAAEHHAPLAARLVRRGMRAAGGRVLRLRVNPADAEPVTAEVLALGTEVPVLGDSTIEAGGCVIDLDGGTVDLRLGVQLDRIERAMVDAA